MKNYKIFNKKISPFYFLFFPVAFINAQQNPNYQNPSFIPQVKSPEVSTLGKYTSMNVNLNTGTPDISIPLFTLSYGGMEVPISLSYDASGIKVEDTASPVGLHWMLNYGGSLGRTVKGGPDEGTTKPFNPNLYNIAPPASNLQINANGYYISNGIKDMNGIASFSPPYLQGVNAYSYFASHVAQGVKDTQPDLYFFNSLGHSGKFFFDDNKKPQLFTEGDYKIFPSLNNGHFEWQINTPSGQQLFFGQNQNSEESLSKIYQYTDTYARFTDNAWSLTKLKNSANNQEIDFTYTKPTFKSLSLTNNSYNDQLFIPSNILAGTTNTPPDTSKAYCEVFLNDLSVKYNNVIETELRQPIIQNITAGDYMINFSTSPKEDGGVKIDEMVVYYKMQRIKKVKFNYSYFTYTGPFFTTSNGFPVPNAANDPGVQAAAKRLKLTSLVETGINDLNPKNYSFQYDESHELPSTLSFAKDMWGYFNGSYGNLSLYPLPYGNNCRYTPGYIGTGGSIAPSVGYAATSRNVDTAYSTIGTLTKITYPTGGSTEYSYENHTGGKITQLGTKIEWTQDGNSNYSTASGSSVTYSTVSSNPIKIVATMYKGGFGPSNQPLSPTCQYGNFATKGYEIFDANGNLLARDNYQKLHSSSTNTWLNQGTFCYNIINSSAGNSGIQSASPNSNCVNLNVSTPTITLKLTHGMDSNNQYSCFNSSGGMYVQNTIVNPIIDTPVGGLRIKEIKAKDSNNAIVLNKTYAYSDPIVMQQPRFSYFLSYFNDNTRGGLINMINSYQEQGNFDIYSLAREQSGSYTFTTPYYNPMSIDFSGPNVSYMNVEETDGNGIIKYNYLPALQYPMYMESIYTSNNFPYNPIIQTATAGKLNFKEVYNKNNVLQRKESYTYKVIQNPSSFPARNISIIKFPSICIGPSGGGSVHCNVGIEVDQPYILNTEKAVLESTQLAEYLNGKILNTSTLYHYNSALHHQLTSEETTLPNTKVIKKSYQYAHEKGNQLMIDKNMIGIPLESSFMQTNNGITKTTSKTETIYPISQSEANIKTSGLVLPLSVLSYDVNDNTASTEVTFNKYDSKGNLQQYTPKNNNPVTIIWGYNQTQPIAKIEGVRLSDISQSLIDSIVSASNADAQLGTDTSEQSLITALDTFRVNLSYAQITTYTYDPLIGVRSITPPSGIREVYIYDSANRLKEVRENNATGNILKEYKYNYKN